MLVYFWFKDPESESPVYVCSMIFTEIIPTKINDIRNMNLNEIKNSIHLLKILVG
jgi:3'-phosphoadenosine 5'-phosphosulfate sulfotransferase